MKKFLAIALVAFGVSACASIPNPIKQSHYNTVQNGYGIALGSFVGYRDACERREIPQSCRLIVPAVQPYVQKARTARINARAFIKNYPTFDATNVLNAWSDATNDLKVVLMEKGVK